MSAVRKLVILASGAASCIAVAVAVFFLAARKELIPGYISQDRIQLFLFVQFTISISAGIGMTYLIRRIWPKPSGISRSTRLVAVIFFILWLITFVFGVPTGQSDQTAWVIKNYNYVIMHRHENPNYDMPYVRTYAAVPVFPGLIFSYHEYQFAGLAGLGTYELRVWYIVGTREIWRRFLWIS